MGWRKGWRMPLLLAAWIPALLSGCASTPGSTPAAGAPGSAGSAEGFSLVTPQEFEQQSPTLGVKIEIDAPGDLKDLLEKHLDLVRLGRVARDDVDDTEWARLIDASPAQVRELLQTEGYFSPRVSVSRTPGRGNNEPDQVKLQVEPGARARITRVTIEAEGELDVGATTGEAHAAQTLAQLRKNWELPSGAGFRNPAWSAAKSAALGRLRAAGYANATWSGTGADVDVAKNEVRLFLVVDSGPLYRLGNFQIEGLAAQDPETVRNLAFTKRGAPVTEALLLDFQERLQKSGLFETVSVTLDADPAKATAADLNVRVREAPLQVYTFAVGISANTGARASVEHLYRRVFGLPASSKLKIEVGQLRQAWDAEISGRPDAGLYRNLLGGAVERLVSDSDVVLSQQMRLGRTQDTQRIERLFYAGFDRSQRVKKIDGEKSTAIAWSGNFHGGWRDLDSVVLPTHGETLNIQLGAGRASGSSNGIQADSGWFARTYGRLTVYRTFGRNWYAQGRLELGQVYLGPNMVVPEALKWRAGGDESVRGYGYRSLGPLVDGAVGSGTALFTGSVELARPFLDSMPTLWGAVFLDAGNAADNFGSIRPVYGTGVGVRWRSPVGPLRLDWAYGSETRKGRIHFSVGIAF